MQSALNDVGYIYDEPNFVWRRSDFKGIDYSDGDEVEDRIEQIIANTTDLRVLSDELSQHITDWPSRYHLASTRANILRPLEAELGVEVLELGAGCGAITRFLGECGAAVTAVEGSLRRARIASLRTRDLANISVVSDSFENFECTKKFDFVTLIGVLEYASIFTPGDNPALNMLQRARSFLKPTGKLILAIENKLGLKYFAGAPEDHVGLPFFGIEDRYSPSSARTYGREQLQQLLERAGFIKSEFLAPFPDYKLPTSILTEKGARCRTFDGGAFAWQTVKQDHQLPEVTSFSIERAWPEVFDNNLGLELSNSFLVISNNSKDEIVSLVSDLAFHFSTNRRRQFCKETKFREDEEGDIKVKYRKLVNVYDGSKSDAHDSPVKWNFIEGSDYFSGTLLSSEWARAFTELEYNTDRQDRILKDYLKIIAQLSEVPLEEIYEYPFEPKLPGCLLDAIPSNILRESSGKVRAFDLEWSWHDGLSPAYLLFRSLSSTFSMISGFGSISARTEYSSNYVDIIVEIMRRAEMEVNFSHIENFLEIEKILYEFVNGDGYQGKLDALRGMEINPGNLPSVQFREMPHHLSALADENIKLHAAKDYAEELAISRMHEITRLKRQVEEVIMPLQSSNSGPFIRLVKKIRNRVTPKHPLR